ncbi:AfsR/SARP family transcriptional regulator [Actinophytocola sp.]|jgi:tetratricopeptide (TPR) repeat protein/DNA-binding SARP family transcriptional activator|uniref:AfsR/SARP family transcriptional regulator n=1 Tax=Actinophytocola sp. TaxID=1872138 RepID=UPI002ED8893F
MDADGETPAGTGTDVLVLGSVVVRHEGRLIAPPSRGGRILLGNLGLGQYRGLRDDTLLERMWPDRSAEDSLRALRVAVHRLRHWLQEAVGDAITVARTSQGYVLEIADGDVDADHFRRLVASSTTLPPADKAAVLAKALELWRGPALLDVPSDSVDRTELHQLSRQRTLATVDYARAMVHIGQADVALRALTPLVADEALNEGVHAAWIEALAVSGRQAAALEAYETLRLRLRNELGIEPSRELSRTLIKVLHQDLPEATADPAPDVADKPAPAQLPAAVSAFTGRREHLRVLDTLLVDCRSSAETMVISAIEGTGGVGKTALAVHWGHKVADQFPDGQLYVDLRGFSRDQPVAPGNALGRLLRGIGLPDGQIPADQSEAAGLYRSALANKRMLIVLDNAANAEQVRPLIPGTPGSLVLVTSRAQLGGLVAIDGARRIDLETLSPDEAVELLTTLLGKDKVAAEPAATAELAAACACLPLALRIAGANLLAHRSQRIADLVRRLRSGHPWTALTVDGDDGATVRLAFDLSYRQLSPPAGRVFRFLGMLPGADTTVDATAALAELDEERTADALAELVDAHLLTEHEDGRYTFHDLLRAYARDLAEHEEPDREAGVRRLAAWYLAAADNAVRQLYPKVLRLPVPDLPALRAPALDDDPAAAGWLATELANLVEVVRHAAAHGAAEVAWLLGDALRIHLFRRRLNAEFGQVVDAALAAATEAGDAGGCAAAELGLATVCRSRGDLPRALHHLRHALDHARKAEWADCQLATLSNIAVIHTEMGELDRATRYLREVQALNRTLGNTAREATAFNHLGAIQFQSGHLAESVQAHRQALAKYHELGDDSYDGLTLHNLGRSLRDLGNPAEAREILDRALRTAHATGDKHIEAGILSDLARLDRDVGRTTEARANAARALTLATDLGDQFEQIAALICLGSIDTSLGALPGAMRSYERALTLARQTSQASPQTESLIGLGAVCLRRGDHQKAVIHAREALARSHECGFRVLEGQALTLLAEIHLAAHRHERAGSLAERAVASHTATEHKLGEARALLVLHAIRTAAGDTEAAEQACRRATEILSELGVPH